MLETFAAAAGARVIAAHRCVEQEVRRDAKQGLRPAKMEELVGARRFELPTPCTPCRCATRLRYAPTPIRNYSGFSVPGLAIAVFPPAFAAIQLPTTWKEWLACRHPIRYRCWHPRRLP